MAFPPLCKFPVYGNMLYELEPKSKEKVTAEKMGLSVVDICGWVD